MYKAYKFDPEKSLVTKVEIKGSRRSIEEVVGGPAEVAMVSENTIRPGRRLILFVNGDGKKKDPRHLFYWGPTIRPFNGNGLLVTIEGAAEKGEIVDVDMPFEEVCSFVTFVHRIDPGGEYDKERSVYSRVGAFCRN